MALALSQGWARGRPADELLLAPLADGGEGTLAAVALAGGWLRRETPVHDPIGRGIVAGWLCSEDGSEGVIELAEASGLSRLGGDERDPIGSSTVGTGELILAALEAGIRRIVLGTSTLARAVSGSAVRSS